MRRISIVNFNAPELHKLAVYLAERRELLSLTRPYLNRDRWWERGLARAPLLGRHYSSTFGRRRLDCAPLLGVSHEAGVLADLTAAALLRLPGLSPATKDRWSFALYERIRAAIRRESARHVAGATHVVAYPGFAREAFAAGRRTGARLVLNYPIAHHRFHDRLRAEESQIEPGFAPTWPAQGYLTERIMAEQDAEIDAADVIVVGSRFAAESFRAVGVTGDKLVVVPYGVDLEVFGAEPPRTPGDVFRVAFAGQISQRKGLSYLLKGYRAFARADTRLLLIGRCIGSDAPLQPYHEIFEHIPHLTRPALAEAFRGCAAFVFPTLLEGMGLVVVEAMACGLPVITTACGPDELVRDGIEGFIVPTRDPDAIADRLDRLYRDPELRRTMARNAQARAREFSWQHFCRRFIERVVPVAVP